MLLSCIKRLRTRHGEFMSHKFVKFCIKHGVQSNFSSSNSTTIQHFLMEKQDPIWFVKIQKHLWNELVNVVAYILNLCPTKANAYMIPYEKKLQSSQTWEYLNFWQSCSCTLAKDDIVNKFGVISIPYTLVGCDSNYKIIQVVQ